MVLFRSFFLDLMQNALQIDSVRFLFLRFEFCFEDDESESDVWNKMNETFLNIKKRNWNLNI